ncbi:pentraxin fusion protein-like isoform X2 [Cheilinus undulatus]|uniref:pentraxin fusion protein-like isoform X2 n=1 Tax=Cheilinus undulatus TaxID=241271 RepID=UPI001BD3EA14|nr:pentraxin fusion protein-like isoform X2 [Cheilinus undulatus]
MRLSVSLVLVSISVVLAGDLRMKTVVFPSETSTSYVEMVPQKPMTLKAFTLCMRVATELPSSDREIILFAYRTRDYDELNVWRETDGRLSFYLSGEGAIFRAPELKSTQTHLCFTWDSSTGAASIYIDGEKSVTKIYKKGHTVRADGKVILGQDPDNFLGDFDAAQSFVGEIFDVNMWDYVLSHGMIASLASWERTPRGNVFDWETIDLTPHGEVEILQTEL